MNMTELRKTLCVSELTKDGKLPILFMPNEIFNDIRDNVNGTSQFVASIYCCYYLDVLLYRYAIYGNNHETLKIPTYKEILGYPRNSRVIDPIIKKDGLLNLMGYTRPESNYPIGWSLTKENDPIYELEFALLKDRRIDEDGKDHGYYLPDMIMKAVANRVKIHYPIKAFVRQHTDTNGEKSELGTFYSISHTHGIELETFLKCMSDPELGVEGFYLYALIKSKSDYFQEYWNVKFDDLIKMSGLKPTKFKEVLLTLREYRMIDVENMPWVIDRPSHISTKSNGYKANDYSQFKSFKQPVAKPIKTSWERCMRDYPDAILSQLSPDELDGIELQLP
ncbi:hypothetical protein [Paenibacillus periandrae]|uniref:hypothetical protein n=1 Tax=Paenibacillus periandrae TaxID=1761741 RepID=UPI001F089D5C|nr:hypothetical protein [Paenibacillus periandrae]